MLDVRSYDIRPNIVFFAAFVFIIDVRWKQRAGGLRQGRISPSMWHTPPPSGIRTLYSGYCSNCIQYCVIPCTLYTVWKYCTTAAASYVPLSTELLNISKHAPTFSIYKNKNTGLWNWSSVFLDLYFTQSETALYNVPIAFHWVRILHSKLAASLYIV